MPGQGDIFDKWGKRMDRYGFPIVALGLLLLGMCVAVGWAKPLGERVVSKVVEFIEEQSRSNAEHTKSDAVKAEIMRGQQQVLDQLTRKAESIDERVRDIHGQVVKRGKMVVGEASSPSLDPDSNE